MGLNSKFSDEKRDKTTLSSNYASLNLKLIDYATYFLSGIFFLGAFIGLDQNTIIAYGFHKTLEMWVITLMVYAITFSFFKKQHLELNSIKKKYHISMYIFALVAAGSLHLAFELMFGPHQVKLLESDSRYFALINFSITWFSSYVSIKFITEKMKDSLRT